MSGFGTNARRGIIKSIQRGTTSITAGNSSATSTISAVDTSKAELRYLGRVVTSTGGDVSGRLVLTNSTTITATREGTIGTTSLSWEVTEFQ